MVRYVNPLKSKINNIKQQEFERLSQEGAKSLNSINKNTYQFNNKSNTIVLQSTKVTNIQMLEETVKNLEKYLSEWIDEPIIISQAITYVECRSILNGKYKDLLIRLYQFNDQAERNSTDNHIAKHIHALTNNLIANSSGLTLSNYITKNVKSIKQLFDKIKWYLEETSNITDRWGNKHKYGLNFVYYANLER